MRKDSANNKSNYSEKEPPNLDSRSRRFTLKRVFGESGCQEHSSPSTGRRRFPCLPAPVTELPSKSAAMRAIESQGLRADLNPVARAPRSVAELVTHYTEKELPENSRKSYSTRKAYQIYIQNWILPKWGEYPPAAIKTVAVEEWLGTLPLAPGTKAKLRNIMSAIFTHAMRNEWLLQNPIRLVRQSAKRQSVPDVLTIEEIGAILRELGSGPYYVMTFLAAVTGLRVSELLALKWEDVRFAAGEIHLSRAIVCQHVGPLKTEASQKPQPMNEELAAVLLSWRSVAPYNQDTDYVFASADKHGDQPLWPSSAMSKHIRPASQRAGIRKHVRSHVFRHTYGTMLNANGADVKTVQELMRHANASTTMDVYVQGVTEQKRAAQRSVLQGVAPNGPTQVATAVANA